MLRVNLPLEPKLPRKARIEITDQNGLTYLITLTVEQYTLNNVNNCLNTNIYSYLETSGGKSCNLYLNDVHFFNTSVNLTSVAA